MNGPVLTRADLAAHNPSAWLAGGGRRRVLCPLPECAGKPRDAAHRTLSVDVGNGAWHCFRCDQSGRLREFWTAKAAVKDRFSRFRATPRALDQRGPEYVDAARHIATCWQYLDLRRMKLCADEWLEQDCRSVAAASAALDLYSESRLPCWLEQAYELCGPTWRMAQPIEDLDGTEREEAPMCSMALDAQLERA